MLCYGWHLLVSSFIYIHIWRVMQLEAWCFSGDFQTLTWDGFAGYALTLLSQLTAGQLPPPAASTLQPCATSSRHMLTPAACSAEHGIGIPVFMLNKSLQWQ
jgi:hypothetical protein